MSSFRKYMTMIGPGLLSGRKKVDGRVPIPQLGDERDACEGRLRTATAELRRIIDGERVVTVSLGSYFAGGVETDERLDAALDGARKKIIVQ